MSKTQVAKSQLTDAEIAEATAERTYDIGGATYRVAKRVTVPTLKHPPGTQVAFTILGPIIVKSKKGRDAEVVDPSTGEITTATIKIARVRELTSQVEQEYVVSAILYTRLTEGYPEHGYIDRTFAVYKGEKNGARGPCPIELLELEQV
jgi:hypothetical protein